VVKCIGCYHGHVDGLLVQAGSGALTLGSPSSPGIPAAIAASTVLVHYNDLAGTEALFGKYADRIACMIVEPVPGNMGVILPQAGYLKGLRKICDRQGAILIFDEVMSGFRVAYAGAQSLCDVRPDLTCLGKVIGGGLPVGAYGGRQELMQMISPSGKVYQAGTLSGNPLAMTGGLATLELLRQPGTYETLEKASSDLAAGLARAAGAAGVRIAINRVGSMLTPFFTGDRQQSVENYEQAVGCDTQAYATFFHAMLQGGVFLPPSQFEAWFVGLAHSAEAIGQTIMVAKTAFGAVAAKRAAGQ
jgi:glutamate-1-semialdehyde 2,1-aminomutase